MKCLQDILDKKNYIRLVQELGGNRVWVPKLGNLGHRDHRYYCRRDDEIRRLRSRGACIKKLAEMYGLSHKRIYHSGGTGRES